MASTLTLSLNDLEWRYPTPYSFDVTDFEWRQDYQDNNPQLDCFSNSDQSEQVASTENCPQISASLGKKVTESTPIVKNESASFGKRLIKSTQVVKNNANKINTSKVKQIDTFDQVSHSDYCIYILTKGEYKGEQCSLPVYDNTNYCKWCLHKKGVSGSCCYIFQRGSKKGKKCDKVAVYGTSFCKECTQKKTCLKMHNAVQCSHILLRGPNKGKQCQRFAFDDNKYCYLCKDTKKK